MSASNPKLHVVHCVDTEGPLHEPLEATFERINAKFDLTLEPSKQLLEQLQRQEVSLNGIEEAVAHFIAPRRLDYLSNWAEVERSISKVTSAEFRERHGDPRGNPYTFSWFIIDIVGYKDNPRQKAEGFHVVWDVYQRLLSDNRANDAVGWHFHSVAPGQHALDYNTCWTNNDFAEQVLCRRIFEREWFPSLFRAGGNIMRNDLSYWLEMFLPFDYSCCSRGDVATAAGGEEDWRRAPQAWHPYHPDFHDYQSVGAMKRSVFRCLPIENASGYLERDQVVTAFTEARETGEAIFAYSNHDRRDMTPDVEYIDALIKDVASDFSDVSWEYTNALDAARQYLKRESKGTPEFEISRNGEVIEIRCDQDLFLGDPFLAVEERGEMFYRDNVTREGERCWAYQPRHAQNTLRIGVAGCNDFGEVGTKVFEL